MVALSSPEHLASGHTAEAVGKLEGAGALDQGSIHKELIRLLQRALQMLGFYICATMLKCWEAMFSPLEEAHSFAILIPKTHP